MKYLVYFCFILTFLFNCSQKSQNETKAKTQANIILFLVDDMGWQDTSVPFWNEMTPFNELYVTPNMERLAADGMKFTQAYATPVCSPTRVSLMTGMNAARHRVTNWTLHKDVLQPMETNHKELTFPKWNVNGLSPDAGLDLSVHADALPMLLKKAGYFTIHAGKAHFAAIGTPAEDPRTMGF
ncbi:MAG: sulfatase-like hydrolase/transferase, partial [Cyclobacteriaceae bacterium]|nr:sulfatase-like hydrolase/transferase [Cyclobacteriaceae bacterium]